MHVSVTIIAKDAAQFINHCLISASKLPGDLVVVVDDRTTDATAEIARKFTSKVFIRKFVNYSDQKNFAATKTDYPWIFSLDADEVLTPQLITQIKTLPEDQNISAYWVPRINKIFGRLITHTNWDPDGIVRLYNKNFASWIGEVHEQVQAPTPLGNLSQPIIHDNYRTVFEFLAKQNNYSTVQANETAREKRFSLISLFWSPIYDFGRRFIWHAGFLDGWHGLFLSYLMAIYHLSVWIKVWQKQNSR